MSVGVEISDWQGLEAVTMKWGRYKAVLVPCVGSNLISLTDKGRDILRSPENGEGLLAMPQCYGVPVLFPPNRIDGGRFIFEGQEYKFEINEKKLNNHLHGFCYNRPWILIKAEVLEEAAVAETMFVNHSHMDFFSQFPHEFEIRMRYTLSESGLRQSIRVVNKGKLTMPLGIGQHTTFAVPFEEENTDFLFYIGVGERWELSTRNLPTGRLLPLKGRERLYAEGVSPVEAIVDEHYTAKEFDYCGRPLHGAVLEHRGQGMRIVYETGPKYGHWMLWNDGGGKGFICVEPQSWAVNAPNLETKKSGLYSLKPGEVWQEHTRIYTEVL